jgi:hypothetical protein
MTTAPEHTNPKAHHPNIARLLHDFLGFSFCSSGLCGFAGALVPDKTEELLT